MRWQLDRGFLLVSLFLIGLGIVQVYSSSFIFAIERFDDGLFFFRRQMLFGFLAIVLMLTVAFLPWSYLRRFGLAVYLVSALGVAATLIPGMGVKVGGAFRWLQLPMGLRLEPSEFLKVGLAFWMAFMLTWDWRSVRPLKMWALWGLSLGLPLALLLRQPDFGSFVICSAVVMGSLFAVGIYWRWVGLGLAGAATAFYVLIVNEPYRLARVKAFLDPWADPEAKGFQVIQSLLSFYSGGLTGVGLGEGQGKLFFLPEAHTDFAAAVLGEEMGFFGVFSVLLLFGYLVFRGLQVSVRALDREKQLVALGITLVFGLGCFLNLGVVMGLLPTKGLALPFLSYGGSSLIASALAIGVLLNIERSSQKPSFRGIRLNR